MHDPERFRKACQIVEAQMLVYSNRQMLEVCRFSTGKVDTDVLTDVWDSWMDWALSMSDGELERSQAAFNEHLKAICI